MELCFFLPPANVYELSCNTFLHQNTHSLMVLEPPTSCLNLISAFTGMDGVNKMVSHTLKLLSSSSSSQAFPITWSHRNGCEFLSSTLSCPIRPPYESFRLIFCVPLHFFPGSGSSTIFLNTFPSFLFLTRPYHFIAFLCDHCHWCHFYSSITCLFLNLSSFITQHIHLSILIYDL